MGYHLFYFGQKGQGVHFLSEAGHRASSLGTKVETPVRGQQSPTLKFFQKYKEIDPRQVARLSEKNLLFHCVSGERKAMQMPEKAKVFWGIVNLLKD